MSGDLRATYRLQLGPDLSFQDALDLTPYFTELGVSHLYLSPVLQARHGSTHGYDGVDPTRVSDELGGEEALRALCGGELGIVLDIVPNHLATSDENELWSDPQLRQRFFDIDPLTGRHRRFFDVDELAGVRVEETDVFERTHALVLGLVREGLVDGLRIDHPDGLANPRAYLERLVAAGVQRIWVEKILASGEQLRDWPVSGTTGYEFLNDVERLFIDPAGETLLTELAGEPRPWPEVELEAKLEQAATTFAPEVDRLRRLLDTPGLERGLASLPVYRTYVEPAESRVEDADRHAVEGLDPDLRRVLLLEERGHDEFVTRFQQTSGAVMAKGVEDTAFYRYVRLLALNEVGGDPGRFSLGVDEFHAANGERAERFPQSLLAGTTHDTKRSADVRARIGVLAGRAKRWREHILGWHEVTAELRTGESPDWTEELFVYQTLIGAWPIDSDRLKTYLTKSLREAKRHSSWTDPNVEWEDGVQRFASGLLKHAAFLATFEPFADEIAVAGARAALGQLVLRFTSPGVPDIYAGDEHYYLALVDPDNRRVVDWNSLREGLAALGSRPAPNTAKLWTVRELLGLRARKQEAFSGSYSPVAAGARTCAYRRGRDVLVAVSLDGSQPKLEPPPGDWRDVLEGLEEAVGMPVATVLERL